MSKTKESKRFNTGKVGISIAPFDILLQIYGGKRHLIPSLALYEVAKVSKFGSSKYDDFIDEKMTLVEMPNNWKRSAMPFYIVLDCADRHFFKRNQLGELNDADSGCHHYGHAILNMLYEMQYLTGEYTGCGWDSPDFNHGTDVHERLLSLETDDFSSKDATWSSSINAMILALNGLDNVILHEPVKAVMGLLESELKTVLCDRHEVMQETERTAEMRQKRIDSKTQNLKDSTEHVDK